MGKLLTISDEHLNEIFEVKPHGGVEKGPNCGSAFLRAVTVTVVSSSSSSAADVMCSAARGVRPTRSLAGCTHTIMLREIWI